MVKRKALRSNSVRTLSELEGVALGIVSQQGPCTPYAVRKSLKSSPSSHWRGSAGAIYPLLERLQKRGLVEAKGDPTDGRGRRVLQITPQGITVLGQWVQQGTTPELVASISDHVRTRVFFLDSLGPRERGQFLDETAAALKQFLKATEERLEQTDRSNDPFAWFACQNAVLQARARVDWITGMQAAMEELEKL